MPVEMQQKNVELALENINKHRINCAVLKLANPDTNTDSHVKERLVKIITSNDPSKSQNYFS